MSNYDLRSTYDGCLTYNVSAPGSGTGFVSLWSLLTAAQKAQLTTGITCVRVDMSPVAAALFEAAPPGSAVSGTNTPGVLDANTAPQTMSAGQKPNESVVSNRPELNIFVQGASTSAVVIACTFYYVNNGGM